VNTVVNKLLDVDRQARQMLDDAKQYYENTIEEISRGKEDIRQSYADRAAGHVAGVRQSETVSVEETVEKIHNDAAEKTRILNETFNLHHQEWEDELFRRCTGSAVPGGEA
jgi:hypothetical protein